MKEKEILKTIIDYYNQNKLMPSMRYLKDKVHVKSINTIYYYIKKLEKEGYLIRNKDNKRILEKNYQDFNKGLRIIKVINSNDTVMTIFKNNKSYLAFKVKDNIFQENGILKNDILIIERTKNLKNNDLGLFIINKKKYIMKYFYQDGFYILESDIKRFYSKVNIIGKAIYLERKIKRD